MKELSNINPDKFYTDLVLNGILIQETVDGSNDDGDFNTFYGFEDAICEAEDEGYTLEEYGMAYYCLNDKIFLVSVFLENNEGCGISELEPEDISSLISELINDEDDADTFYANNSWATQFK